MLALIVAGGAVSGVAAKLADESAITGMADLGTSPTIWVLSLAVIARFAPTEAQAALRAAAFFVAMSIGYYAWTSLVLGYPGSGPLLLRWVGVAFTLVPLVAALVRWACHQSGAGSGLVLAAAASLALADPRVRQLWYAAVGDLPSDFPLRPVQAVVSIATALVITLWLPRRAATRAWAGALLVPVTLLGSAALSGAPGNLLPS